MVRMHMISSIGSLSVNKEKNHVRQEIDRYMEQLRWEATNDDLDMSIKGMKKYIGSLTRVNTMLCMLQDELDKGSKTIYPKAMEEKLSYQEDTIKQYGETIT